ncbi:hypothetical protein [Kribbella pittospori]|uniref:hypothetical protein n=1 Tax=Kribbella pittospori TaxID=722689 RepID=UPI00192E0686|nr:hypothetical protein [Kribbella pittospori]
MSSDHDYPTAVSDALLSASALMLVTLLIAIVDLVGNRRPDRGAVVTGVDEV